MFFAALEARVNANVLQHLANARVLIGGAEVRGIFRSPASVAALGNGAADTSPSVTVDSCAVPAEPVDKLIEINGVPFAICAAAPDGTGLTTLTVEQVQ